MLQDDVYKLAKQHLKAVESCCGVDAKFCKNDIWKGDLMQFALAVIALNQWQPIETVPKDGLPFTGYANDLIDLDFNPTGTVECFFNNGKIIGCVWNNQQDCWDTVEIKPTHWQPLPQSPNDLGDL